MKKRLLSALLALSMVLALLPAEALAAEGADWIGDDPAADPDAVSMDRFDPFPPEDQEEPPSGIDDTETGIRTLASESYTLENGAALDFDSSTGTITKCRPNGVEEIVIPSELGGAAVISIGERAFYCHTSLTGITIPDSVTSIGNYAFFGCTSLTGITIPNSVTSIGEYAFSESTGLTSVTIPDSVISIGKYAFQNCTSLTGITIPDSVTSIGVNAFAGCKSLTGIIIPDSVTGIGAGSFQNCTNLTSVTIPDSVTQIENFVFRNCTSLISITIPDSVTSIGREVFSGCTGLTSITVPDRVTSIGEGTFSDCTSLTSITIPNGVTGIGYEAFRNCTGLTDITIPDSVTSIGNDAFYGCTSLTGITIPDGVTSIGNYVFYGCTGLTSVTIPDGVTSIGNYAFYRCTSLTSITIPASVTSIGEYAFYGCTSLTSITIPDGVTSIRDYVFSGCTGLTSVTIPDSVISIGNDAFYGCMSLTSITIPNRVTSLGKSAFSGCTGLTSITVPDSVTSIGEYVFSGCTGLTGITIPDSVTSIGNYVFKSCTSLTSITISDSVTSIGEGAFWECTRLTGITIPDSVTSIGMGVFACCDNLTEIQVDSDNPNYKSVDGILFSKNLGTLLSYPAGKSNNSYTIPSTVISIADTAFSSCTSLISIAVPDSVTSIGNWAFCDCTSLTSITIPDRVTSIGEYAFYECTSLTSIIIPDSVTSIGENAFFGVHSDFLLFCHPGSYAERYAKNNQIKYKFIGDSARTLSVSVLDENNAALAEGFTVTWYDAAGAEAGTGLSLSGADEEKSYSFEIRLGDELAAVYEQPERQTVAPEDPEVCEVRLTLKPVIPTLTLTGRVLDEAGQPLEGAAVSAGVSGNPPVETGTDAGGEFRVTVPCAPVTVSVQKEGYYREQRSLDLTGETEEEYAAGDFSLKKASAVSDRITLKVTRRRAAEQPEQARESAVTSLKALRFTLTAGDGHSITDYELQGSALLFGKGAVSADETVAVSVEDPAGSYTGSSAQVTLDRDRLGSAALTLTEKGGLLLGTLSGPEATLLVFDRNGRCVRSSAAQSGTSVETLEAGAYRVVLLQRSDLLRSVPSLEYLSALGLKSGEDYLLKEVSVEDGRLLRLEDCTVPALNESAISYVVQRNTSVSTNKAGGAAAGELIMVCAAYELDPAKGAAAETLRFVLPEGVNRFVQSSATVNGRITPYTYDAAKREISVPVSGAARASVYIHCTAEEAGTHSISACLTLKGGAVQPVGSAPVQVETAKLEVPEKTDRAEGVTASGKTLPNSTVILYDNDTEVGRTTSNAVGSWAVEFDLAQPVRGYSYHYVYAETENSSLSQPVVTEEALVTYSESFTAKLTRITMYNTGDHGPQTTVFDFTDTLSTKKPYYRMWPGRFPTFTFKVEFDAGVSGLSEVYVVTTNGAGDQTYVETTYDEASGAWVGAHNYTSFSAAPVRVGASYKTGEKETPLTFGAEAYLELVADAGQYELSPEVTNQLQQSYSIVEDKTSVKYDEATGNGTVSAPVTYTDGNGTQTEFGTYTIDIRSLSQKECQPDALKQAGYSPVSLGEGNSLWEKKGVDGADYNRSLVDVSEGTAWTETLRVDKGVSRPDLAEYAAGISDAADYLSALPGGYGLIAEATKGFVDYGGYFFEVNATLNGNKAALETRNEAMRQAIQQMNCSPETRAYLEAEVKALEESTRQYVEHGRRLRNGNIISIPAGKLTEALLGNFIGEWLSGKLPKKLTDKIDNFYQNKTAAEAIIDAAYEELNSAGFRAELLGKMELILKKTLWGLPDFMVEKIGGEIVEKFTNKVLGILEMFKLFEDTLQYLNGEFVKINEGQDALTEKILAVSKGETLAGMDMSMGMPVSYIADPSGCVYEAVPSNRLEGVTAVISCEAENGNAWNAGDYDQLNPQITGADGGYYWDVPEGKWKVSFTKEGWLPANTEQTARDAGYADGWLPVPPPQLEINVGMVSAAAPAVVQTAAYGDQIVVEFSQYMDPASVASALTLTRNGAPAAITVTPLNAEYNLEETVQYATRFAVVPEDGDFSGALVVSAASSAKNYAGRSLEGAYRSQTMTAAVRPESISAPDAVSAVLHTDKSVAVSLKPGIAGKRLTVTCLTPALLSLKNGEAVTGENGGTEIVFTGLLPGEGILRIEEPESGLSRDILVKLSQTKMEPAAYTVAEWHASNGSATVRLSDPDGLLKDGGKVYAAHYDANGRMTELAEGRLSGAVAAFSKELSDGWVLYFLDAGQLPAGPSIRLEE